jgi:hypothetical protein
MYSVQSFDAADDPPLSLPLLRPERFCTGARLALAAVVDLPPPRREPPRCTAVIFLFTAARFTVRLGAVFFLRFTTCTTRFLPATDLRFAEDLCWVVLRLRFAVVFTGEALLDTLVDDDATRDAIFI